MGKRRNTAKTGDKAIYRGRNLDSSCSSTNIRKNHDTNNDPMFNEIDRFHNEREQEFIRLDGDGDRMDSDYDDHDLTGNNIAVLDLGAGGGESSSEDDEVDSDEEEKVPNNEKRNNTRGTKDDNEYSESSDSDSESDSDENDNINDLKDKMMEAARDPRNWGKKKSMYYHGDTADLEIGQQEEDAFLEEEAAKEIQASRFEEMDEDDFVLSDDEVNHKDDWSMKNLSTTEAMKGIPQSTRDSAKLTKREARKLLHKRHPELLPMVSYFSGIVMDLKGRTDVATKALMDSEGTAEVSKSSTLQYAFMID